MGVKDFTLFTVNFWRRYDWHLRDKGERMGQARMNALSDLDPELYSMIQGTEFDCFHLDGRIDAFDKEVFGMIYVR